MSDAGNNERTNMAILSSWIVQVCLILRLCWCLRFHHILCQCKIILIDYELEIQIQIKIQGWVGMGLLVMQDAGRRSTQGQVKM